MIDPDTSAARLDIAHTFDGAVLSWASSLSSDDVQPFAELFVNSTDTDSSTYALPWSGSVRLTDPGNASNPLVVGSAAVDTTAADCRLDFYDEGTTAIVGTLSLHGDVTEVEDRLLFNGSVGAAECPSCTVETLSLIHI